MGNIDDKPAGPPKAIQGRVSGIENNPSIADNRFREGGEGMVFRLVTIENQGIVHVASEGNLTSADLDPTGKNPLESLLGDAWKTNRVLLNLTKTAYLDSCAVGWLIGTNRAFREAGGKIVLHSLQPAVRQLLDVLKVGRAVQLVEGEAAARTALTTVTPTVTPTT
jgi:anti-anti-sigma factor